MIHTRVTHDENGAGVTQELGYRRSRRLTHRQLRGQVLVRPQSGEPQVLQGVAALAWVHLDSRRTFPELLVVIEKDIRHGVASSAAHDVEALLRRALDTLRDRGLIEVVQ